MPRIAAYSGDRSFVPSPQSQIIHKDLPAHLERLEGVKQNAKRVLALKPNAKVLVNMNSGPVEAVLVQAYAWRADQSVVVAVVRYDNGKTGKVEGSRVLEIRTKGKK
jgi:hypothetical protein